MSFVFDIAAAQQISALGKYNQSVQNRNALIKEQEAEAIKKQTEFDIAKFDQQFERLTGQTKVATLKSGVELSGSALNVNANNNPIRIGSDYGGRYKVSRGWITGDPINSRRPCRKVLVVLIRVGRVPEQLRGNFSGLQERTMTTVISRQVRRKSGMK